MGLRILLALGSGVVLSFGFEPVTIPWLIPLCVAGFWLACYGTTIRRGFLVGLVFGGAFMFTHTFWQVTVGWDAYLLMATALMLYHGPLGALATHVMRYRWWPWALPVAWVAIEWARSTWPFSGMPWGRLAYGVIDTPIASALPYIGSTGVSLMVALMASFIAWTVVNRQRWRLGAAALAAVALVVAIPVVRPWDPEPSGEVSAAVVQGDVPGEGSDILLDPAQVTRNHADATVSYAEEVAAGDRPQPDFVIWPENSTVYDPFQDSQTRASIDRAVEALGVPLLVGAMVDGDELELFNQGIVWDPETGPGERYTKHNPVPFGEYLPFRNFFDGWNLGRLHDIPRDMQAGTRVDPLDIAGIPVADAICFDIAFDPVLYDQMKNGAQMLSVQTSNVTYIHTRQIDQQYAITRVRALELGRSIYVASPNGLTGIIGADGDTVAIAERQTTDVLDATMPLHDTVTPAVRVGDWLAKGAALLTALYVAFHIGRKIGRSWGGRTTPATEQTVEVGA